MAQKLSKHFQELRVGEALALLLSNSLLIAFVNLLSCFESYFQVYGRAWFTAVFG